ncbi:MAG: hypothetical protein H7145_09905 [Akkermansiaceae bacterium]|nr:hypothetical protein [Armatimonadota bacterium]
MIQKKRIAQVVLSLTGFFLLASTFRWYRDTYIPIAEPYASLPDAAKVGDVKGAMTQTAGLVQELKANDWKPFNIPLSLLRLADAQLAVDVNQRDKNTSNYAFPALNKSPDNPSKDTVATYTDIYVRANPKWFKGERTVFAPTGFYIVGWKDGRVTQVPIEDVRFVKTGKYNTAVFPGMEAWRKNGVRYEYIEFADGYEKARPEAKAFYKSVPLDDDCATCTKPLAS